VKNLDEWVNILNVRFPEKRYETWGRMQDGVRGAVLGKGERYGIGPVVMHGGVAFQAIEVVDVAGFECMADASELHWVISIQVLKV
jgi:hypothetical protein